MSRRPFRGVRRVSLVVGALLVALAGLTVMRCGANDADDSATAATISAPAEVVAGARIDVVVDGAGRGRIDLDVIDAFTTTTLSEHLVEGTARFTLPSALSELSGLLTLRAHGGLGETVIATTRIIPATPREPIDIHAGPRTIVADGADQTMAIVIPTDVFGNPLSDGTTVTITRLDSAGSASARRALVEDGLAALLISSDTTAERIEVFAALPAAGHQSVGSPASRRVDFHEVPGSAAAVDLERADDDALVADGRGVVEVRTKPISDRFGNQLLDGHVVRVQSDGPDGSGQLTARTIDGIARFEMPVPHRPGTTTLTALVGGVESAPVRLEFEPAVSVLPIDVSSEGGQIEVAVGPVLDADGAVVTDGTVVTVTGFPEAESAELQLIRGRASIVVDVARNLQDDDRGFEIRASVLGVSTVGVAR